MNYLYLKKLGVCRSAYYKWKNQEKSQRDLKDQFFLGLITKAYEERNGILGYRQMTMYIRRKCNIIVNHKKIYRIMKTSGTKIGMPTKAKKLY